MTHTKKHILELHEEVKNWKSALDLVNIETRTMTKQLENVAGANNKDDVMARVEHFQNMFIRQGEVNDELMHDINEAHHHLVTLVEANQTASDHRLVDDTPELRNRVETHHKLFADLRTDFNRFAGEWL